MDQIYDDQYCFVCGMKNKIGLKLAFHFDQEKKKTQAEVTFPKLFQGWADMVHGGLISTVLDEIMVKTAQYQQMNCVTAEIKTKFSKPAKVMAVYHLAGWITEEKNKLIFARSELTDPENGDLIASATATLFKLKR